MAKTVGIVGLGRMGSAMAEEPDRGRFRGGRARYRRGARRRAGGDGRAPGRQPARGGRGCGLRDDLAPQRRRLQGGDRGRFRRDRRGRDKPGLVAFDTSTLPIAVKEAGRKALAGADGILLDTPLSGTGAQALTRDLVVYASGDSAAIASLTDVFEGFSRVHYDLGEFGNGSRMKFVANLLVAIHNVAAGEAFALGIKAGLDPERIYEVISNSAATSRIFEIRGPQMVAGDYSRASASIDMQLKDMKVIGDFLAETGCVAPCFAASGRSTTRHSRRGVWRKTRRACAACLRGWREWRGRGRTRRRAFVPPTGGVTLLGSSRAHLALTH